MALTASEIYQLHLDWADKQNKDSQTKELQADRIGKLRGGSVGCVGAKGEIYGTCPRSAIARSWGYNGDELDLANHLMFEGGRRNEGACDSMFEEMLGQDSVIPEGDPRSVVSWQLPDGRTIGGSPDGILVKPSDKVLLEYKRISSAWTARKVSIKLTPKQSHIIQAAHYMGVSGLSKGILYYRQDVNFACPGIGKMDSTLLWPEESPVVEYDNDFPRMVKPHVSLYDLLLDDKGMLWIRHHSQTDFRPTLISSQGIYNYYKLVSDQDATKTLGKKPTRNYPTEGKVDKGESHSPCEYCPLKEVCATNPTYSQFRTQVESKIRN